MMRPILIIFSPPKVSQSADKNKKETSPEIIMRIGVTKYKIKLTGEISLFIYSENLHRIKL